MTVVGTVRGGSLLCLGGGEGWCVCVCVCVCACVRVCVRACIPTCVGAVRDVVCVCDDFRDQLRLAEMWHLAICQC